MDRLKVRECFEASDWGFVVEGSLFNPLIEIRFPERGKMLFRVDTGFSGSVIVTGDIFEFLGLADIETPEDIRPSYRTLAGPLTMRSAPAILEIDGKAFETDVLTPILAPSRIIIGFEMLKKFDLALLRERACFVTR